MKAIFTMGRQKFCADTNPFYQDVADLTTRLATDLAILVGRKIKVIPTMDRHKLCADRNLLFQDVVNLNARLATDIACYLGRHEHYQEIANHLGYDPAEKSGVGQTELVMSLINLEEEHIPYALSLWRLVVDEEIGDDGILNFLVSALYVFKHTTGSFPQSHETFDSWILEIDAIHVGLAKKLSSQLDETDMSAHDQMLYEKAFQSLVENWKDLWI